MKNDACFAWHHPFFSYWNRKNIATFLFVIIDLYFSKIFINEKSIFYDTIFP